MSPIILYISYALPHCTTEMIRTKFDDLFMNCVLTIAEEVKEDTKNVGKKFKRFWVNIDNNRYDHNMRFILETIVKEGSAKVYYEKTHGVDRFWKVKQVSEWPF